MESRWTAPHEEAREAERYPDEEREPLLSALFADRVSGRAWATDGRSTRVTAYERRPEARFPLRWRLEEPLEGPLNFRVEGTPYAYDFGVRDTNLVGELLETEEPAELIRVTRRRALRAEAPGGLQVAFVHPTHRRLFIHGAVADVSSGGLSFRPGRSAIALVPGMTIPQVRLTWDEGSVELPGRVAHVGSDGEPCGLALQPGAEEDTAIWRKAVELWLYPETRCGRIWADASWRLYERSGYFGLSGKTPASFSHLRTAFASVSRTLDLAPDLGRQIVWPSARGLEASVSTLRVYSGTSLLYQVARRKDEGSPASGRRMLRALNLHALEHLREDPSVRWLLIYVQENGARWSRFAYRGFAERLAASPESCRQRFHALEASSSRRQRRPVRPLEIGRALPSELGAVLKGVSVLPVACREALDLTAETLSLEGLASSWRRHGLERSRELLIARVARRPIALAIVESAEDGLHLFGLLDLVRMFPLVPGGRAAFPSLLDAARGWFHTKGKERFVYFSDGRDLRIHTGLRDLGVADLLAFSARNLGGLMERIQTVTREEAAHG